MAIAVKLDDLLHARRMTLTDLAETVGITLDNLSILKTGKARAIRFTTLEAICAALDCQPGDLIEYRPSEDPAARGDTADPARFPQRTGHKSDPKAAHTEAGSLWGDTP